ncbi:flavin reductase family protein [Sessilibacter sp. MAH4]
MIFNLDELSPTQRYFTLTQSIVPRPVAWVLSENANKSYNLAPYSYFSGVASDPPLVMISVGKKNDGSLKDTRTNIIERSEYVIHIPHQEMAHAVTESARPRPEGESEVTAQNLELCEFEGFRLPRLKAARIALACEKYRVEDITDSQAMILGLIKAVYVDDDLITEFEDGRVKIDAQKLQPIGRLGGDDYTGLGEIITVPRPR